MMLMGFLWLAMLLFIARWIFAGDDRRALPEETRRLQGELGRLREEVERLSGEVERLTEEQSFLLRLLAARDAPPELAPPAREGGPPSPEP